MTDSASEAALSVSVTAPIQIVSAANRREHWAAKASRVKAERHSAYWSMLADRTLVMLRMALHDGQPLEVRLIRIIGYRGKPLDDDNLASGCKAARDGAADYFGVADNDPRLRWNYGQQKGAQWALRIEVRQCGST